MKMIEIKCPSCGGKLTISEKDPRLITCEYCGNQFLLEDEKVQQNITNYHIHQYPAKAGLAVMGIAAVLVFMFVVSSGPAAKSSSRVQPSIKVDMNQSAPGGGKKNSKAAEKPTTPLYQAMVEDMFQKPYSQVTEEELGQIKYLKVSTTLNGVLVEYSRNDPYGDGFEVQKSQFDRLEWDSRDIAYFTGLTCVDLTQGSNGSLNLSDFKDLKGLRTRKMSPQEVADMVADPKQIVELSFGDIESLEGLSAFENLEILALKDVQESDLKQAVPLKKLKSLSVEDNESSSDMVINTGEKVNRMRDYSAVSVMAGLESLSLKSDLIRDIGFVKDLPALTSLSLRDTTMIGLDSLAGNTTLRSLTLDGNHELQTYQAVGTITGLEELIIDKETSQQDPDLSALSQLKKLDISGFMSVSSLKNLSQLKELSVHSCNLDGAGVFSSLTGVEKLTMYSVWNSAGALRNLDFISGMTGLKYVDLNGNRFGENSFAFQNYIEVYGDVSSVFSLPNLEELYLNDGKFEINFDRVKENPSLRILGLKGLELHKNYQVQSYGAMSNVWYDDVKLDEHTSFLTKFPNLEELYLDGNKLTNLAFAPALKQLKKLSISDNYITDLGPLVSLEHLNYLNVAENPVGDLGNMKDGIQIVR